MSQSGRRFGTGYELRALIAQGGMGAVYQAFQPSLSRYVAVKIIDSDKDDGRAERFVHEARIVASLQHPNIVPVYDLIHDEGRLYLVMEYAVGETLHELINREAPLSPDRAVRLAGQLADALTAAHAKGVIHRDLKPKNVMVHTSADGEERARVLDFGIARLFHAGSRLTATGVVCGTPQYMSPEQAQGNPGCPQSDVYSLALITYELLDGRPPFAGTSTVEQLHAHVYEAPRPLSRSTSKGLVKAVMRGLEKSTSRRPESAALFKTALEHAMLQSQDSARQVPIAGKLADLQDALAAILNQAETDDEIPVKTTPEPADKAACGAAAHLAAGALALATAAGAAYYASTRRRSRRSPEATSADSDASED